jgi:hypothetical protein
VGTQFDAGLGHACRSAGVEPHIVHRADDATLLQTLAGSGLGSRATRRPRLLRSEMSAWRAGADL